MAVLWLCFTISGVAALAAELLWMRSAGLVLGATAPTAATVVAWYFAGLGLGAAAARRPLARPVVGYALLELGAAAGVLWSLVVFRALALDGAQRALAAGGPAAALAAVGVAVLPATVCFGATLPVLGSALAAPGTVGGRGGLLYALNTIGGALGIAAVGFGLPHLIGIGASYVATAATSALAGVVTLVVGRRVAPSAAAGASEARAAAARGQEIALRASRTRLRTVAAGAGALGLGLEILWTRLFAQVLHNSVYSFAAVSLVFVLALAAGAALGALALRRLDGVHVAAGALLAAALATVGGFWGFVWATGGLDYVGMRTGLGEYLLRIVALAGATAGPAALASGAVLPALWAAFGDRAGAARPMGDLTAANTWGAIGGALAVGFVVPYTIGLRGGVLLAALAYLVLADATAPAATRLRWLAYATVLAVALADPLRAPLGHLAPGESLRSRAEGAAGIVTVVDTGDDLQLRLDNAYVLGGSAAATNERRQGLLPLLLHPHPRHAMFIGMATGISASAAPALGVGETTVVELVPEVAEAARTHFATWNASLLARSDVRLAVADGRQYLAATGERFDVIVSDLFIPWHAGAGALYAREMYEGVARRLAPDGLFCQWLPLYQLTREEFGVIVRTLLAVFPHVSMWRDDFFPDRPVAALVAERTPRTLDLERLRPRLDALPDWSRDPLLSTPRGLAMLYVGDLDAALDLVGAGPLNTDDRPLIEFLAPRLTRVGASGDKDWFIGETLAGFAEALAERAAAGTRLPPSPDVAEARRAGAALYRYALAAGRGDEAGAASEEREVRRLVPEVVSAGESENAVATLADTQRKLGALKLEQERVRHALEAMERRLDALASVPEEGP